MLHQTMLRFSQNYDVSGANTTLDSPARIRKGRVEEVKQERLFPKSGAKEALFAHLLGCMEREAKASKNPNSALSEVSFLWLLHHTFSAFRERLEEAPTARSGHSPWSFRSIHSGLSGGGASSARSIQSGRSNASPP